MLEQLDTHLEKHNVASLYQTLHKNNSQVIKGLNAKIKIGRLLGKNTDFGLGEILPKQETKA